ncbi:glycosyltransferase family 2 protein [Salegentibacter sp. F14]
MMDQDVLVSVIMPAYNSGRFIKASIESVIKQTYSNWELIVIDDASEDQTLEIIKDYAAKDKRFKIILNEKNQGAGVSRNKGIKEAKGDYIAFLDADDLWKPHKLHTQLNFMKENDVTICFSSYEQITENGEIRRVVVQALPYVTYQKLLKSNYIGNLTGIYNIAELGKIFGPEIRKRQDWGLWLAAVKKARIAKSIKEPLAIYRLRKNSVSRNKFKMLRYNFIIYYKVLGFGFFNSLRCMLMFLKEHFFIKKKQLRSS